MTNILKQTIENKLYSYNPNEFMPIWCEGELMNRTEFIAYKARRAMQKAGKGITWTILALDDFLKPAGRV